MEKYNFVTTETVDEILKEHTIRAIEIAAEMNARLADGNCLLGFEKLYREVYPLIVVLDPARMIASADTGTPDEKDANETKLIKFIEIMENTKPEKITNEQEREALECFPAFIREYGWGIRWELYFKPMTCDNYHQYLPVTFVSDLYGDIYLYRILLLSKQEKQTLLTGTCRYAER